MKCRSAKSAWSAEDYCTKDPLNERAHYCTNALLPRHGYPAREVGVLLHYYTGYLLSFSLLFPLALTSSFDKLDY